MNQHDPWLAECLGNIVSLTLVDHPGLIDLINRLPTLAPSLRAMFAGLLPQCGPCEVDLTWAVPLYLWGLVQRRPQAVLLRVCCKCAAGDTISLARAVLAFFGAQRIEPANLHLSMRGRA
jgi:hypothetical protein